MERITESYPSDLRQISRLREAVRDVCNRVWIAGADTADAIDLLVLAVDEAATNIVLHAYDGRPDGLIELTAVADAEQVVVTLSHHGRDFDPATVPPPSYDGSRESGFGLSLIRQSVDDVCYSNTGTGVNSVRLVKRRPST